MNIDTSTLAGKIAVMQGALEGLKVEEKRWGKWRSVKNPGWDWDLCDFRLVPLEFQPLPEGLEYHNPAGLTPEQVEVHKGWRLAVKGEKRHEGYQAWNVNLITGIGRWGAGLLPVGTVDDFSFAITFRFPADTPLPEPPKKPVMIPLSREDIDIRNDIVRKKSGAFFCAITGITNVGFSFSGGSYVAFEQAQEYMEISRDGGKTWSPCEKPAPEA